MGVEEIPISELSLDERFQHREDGLDAGRVTEYAEVVDRLPPPVIFRDGKKNWFPGGFHRLAAHEKAGREKIRCTIRTGNWLDAYCYSLAENAEHGMRRTNADKRKAVLDAKAINDERNLGWSNREICRKCLVGESYIKDLRQRESELSESPNTEAEDSKLNVSVESESNAPPHVNVTVQEWVADGKLSGAEKDAVLSLGGTNNAAREAKQSQYVRRRLPPVGMTHAQAIESVRAGGKRDAPAMSDEERQAAIGRFLEAVGTLKIEATPLGVADRAEPHIVALTAMV